MPRLQQCGNVITISEMIKAALGEDANNLIQFKIVKVAAQQAGGTPIDCGTYEEFINLLKQCWDLSVAGVVSFRVIETTNSGASNVVQAMRCAQHEEWWRVFSRAFYLDINDLVALRIMDTT